MLQVGPQVKVVLSIVVFGTVTVLANVSFIVTPVVVWDDKILMAVVSMLDEIAVVCTVAEVENDVIAKAVSVIAVDEVLTTLVGAAVTLVAVGVEFIAG